MLNFSRVLTSVKSGLNRYLLTPTNARVRAPEIRRYDGLTARGGKPAGAVAYSDKTGQVAFLDKGRAVIVAQPKSEQAISLALNHAMASRKTIKVQGSDAFKERTALAALRGGFQDRVNGIDLKILQAAQIKFRTEEAAKKAEAAKRTEQSRLDQIDKAARERKVSQEKARQIKETAKPSIPGKKTPTVVELQQRRADRNIELKKSMQKEQERHQSEINAAAKAANNAQIMYAAQRADASQFVHSNGIENQRSGYSSERESQLQARYDQAQREAQAVRQKQPDWAERERAEYSNWLASQREKYRENAIQGGPAGKAKSPIYDSRHEPGSRRLLDAHSYSTTSPNLINAAGEVLSRSYADGKPTSDWAVDEGQTKLAQRNLDYRRLVEGAGGRFENQKPVSLAQLEKEREAFLTRQDMQQKAGQGKIQEQAAKPQRSESAGVLAQQTAKSAAPKPRKPNGQQPAHFEKPSERVQVREVKAQTQVKSRAPAH